MNIIRLLLLIAVAGFYGCSDKEDAAGGEDTTSLLEKADQLGTEMADKTEQVASDTGKIVTESLDTASDKIGDAVDSASQAGSQAVESVVEKSSELTASVSEAMPDEDSIDPEQVAMGKLIYSKHCMACHAAGVAGAPKLSDAAGWEPRIAQGMDTLFAHAINGFQGKAGYMPPKGGFTTLNDDEVKAAVTYMVSASQK